MRHSQSVATLALEEVPSRPLSQDKISENELTITRLGSALNVKLGRDSLRNDQTENRASNKGHLKKSSTAYKYIKVKLASQAEEMSTIGLERQTNQEQ